MEINIRIICFVLFSFFFLPKMESQNTFKHHQINTNLLSLVNFEFSSLSVGYEFRFEKYLGIEVSYGHILPRGEWWNESDVIDKKSNRGNSIRVEPKIYVITFIDEKENGGVFISAKFYRTNYDYTSVRLKDPNDFDDLASYSVSRINTGIIYNIGLNSALENRIFIEVSFGLGNKRSVTENDYDGNLETLLGIYRPTDIKFEQNGSLNKFRANLNFKVGVAF